MKHAVFQANEYVDPKLESALKDISPDNPWVVLLSPAQLVEIQQAFSKFDRDGDGHIEAKELMTVMNVMGIRPTQDQLQEMIQAVDTDGNGTIEFEEFIALMARRMLKDDGQAELDEAFKLFDADGSGTISLEEVRDLMTSVGQGLTEEEINELMTMADVDGNGQISLEEFKAMECWKVPALIGKAPLDLGNSASTAAISTTLPSDRAIRQSEQLQAQHNAQ